MDEEGAQRYLNHIINEQGQRGNDPTIRTAVDSVEDAARIYRSQPIQPVDFDLPEYEIPTILKGNNILTIDYRGETLEVRKYLDLIKFKLTNNSVTFECPYCGRDHHTDTPGSIMQVNKVLNECGCLFKPKKDKISKRQKTNLINLWKE